MSDVLADLLAYGVEVLGDRGWAGALGKHKPDGDSWTLAGLDLALESVRDLAKAMGGPGAFRSKLGGVKLKQKAMKHGGLGRAHRVTLNAAGFDKWTIVHELGHAWDAAHGWKLSRDMREKVGAGFRAPVLHRLFPKNAAYWYDPGQGPPPCGVDAAFNPLEDFAEAVAAYIYLQEAQQRAAARGWPYVDAVRGYTYVDFYATPRGKFVAGLMAT
ncbi:MAG: hypothetical protein JXA21_29690 [Anaerolineae bacterium]|nr:hypothetical protein [Anaerolineae bacterium]